MNSSADTCGSLHPPRGPAEGMTATKTKTTECKMVHRRCAVTSLGELFEDLFLVASLLEQAVRPNVDADHCRKCGASADGKAKPPQSRDAVQEGFAGAFNRSVPKPAQDFRDKAHKLTRMRLSGSDFRQGATDNLLVWTGTGKLVRGEGGSFA